MILKFLKAKSSVLSLMLAALLAAGMLMPAVLEASEEASEELLFTILHTNDEHSAVIPHSPAIDYSGRTSNPSIGGFSRLATAVNQIREQKRASGEPVILASGGDFMGGTPFSWLIPQGVAAELVIMQQIGYDAVTIGNHEYDYGADKLALYLEAAGYPQSHDRTAVLATNTVSPPDHPMAGLYRDTHIIKLDNGLTIGLLGLLGIEAEDVAYSVEPLYFEDRHAAAGKAVDKLQGQGADIIVALTHSGIKEDRALAQAVEGIHVIVGGHCHTELHEPIIEADTVIVQAGSRLDYLGVLELAYDRASKELRIRNFESSQPFLVAIDDSFGPDPDIDSAIGGYVLELSAFIHEKTGGLFTDIMDIAAVSDFPLTAKPPLRESPMGNFVTDAMRMVTWEKTGEKVDFALQANGNIRGSVLPGTMEHTKNNISFYDLTMPMSLGIGQDGQAGYSITSIYLTGEEVYRVLEVAVLLKEMLGDTFFLQFSGLRYDYNPANAILFTVPFIDQPIPSALLPGELGAVLNAERYTGDGVQADADDKYVPLVRGDQELYHLATDNYILSFLPMVGQMLPMLEIIPKDREGNPVPQEHYDELIVDTGDGELKIWQAVAEYASAQPVNQAGLPQIDDYYSTARGRINRVWSFPFIAWPLIFLAVVAALIALLVRRRRRRRRSFYK